MRVITTLGYTYILSSKRFNWSLGRFRRKFLFVNAVNFCFISLLGFYDSANKGEEHHVFSRVFSLVSRILPFLYVRIELKFERVARFSNLVHVGGVTKKAEKLRERRNSKDSRCTVYYAVRFISDLGYFSPVLEGAIFHRGSS